MHSLAATHRSALLLALTVLIGWTTIVLDSSAAETVDVLVVTDTQHPVIAPSGTRVIFLDAPNRLKAELSSGLPKDAEPAASLVRQRLNAGGIQLQRSFQRAYQD